MKINKAIDGLFVFILGKSWALELIPNFGIVTQTSSDQTPFLTDGFISFFIFIYF